MLHIVEDLTDMGVSSIVKVALTLQDADGNVIKNRCFETMYEGE